MTPVELRKTEGPVQIAFEGVGDDGSPVILVMGYAMTRVAWADQVAGLRDNHRVVTFDNRGVGRSDRPAGPYTMAQLAGDTLAVLDALEWEDAHVVGVSMGGMVAQHVALTAPARVRSLSLIATHAGGMFGRLPTLLGLGRFARVIMGPERGRAEAFQRLLYPEAFLATAPQQWFDGALEAQLSAVPEPHVRRAQMAAILGHDTRANLGRLGEMPTLVIGGSEDILVRPAACARLASLIEGARYERIEGAGHGVTRQCPERINTLLLSHFAAADSSRGPFETAQRAQTGQSNPSNAQ